MGENLRLIMPVSYPDPEGCASDLTRTNSYSSAITVESSGDCSANAGPGQSMVWTDEKHNLYLDFLEASFVKHLYHSMSLQGSHSHEQIPAPYQSQKLQASAHNSSDQFLVMQDCCWPKINYESNGRLLDRTADSDDILENPWTRQVVYGDKCCSAASFDSQETGVEGEGEGICSKSVIDYICELERSSEQHPEFHFCHQSLFGNTTEVSDQNFVDEEKRKGSCMSRAKRFKMEILDASSSDQVVPVGKLNPADDSTINETCSKKGKKKLLSEYPESFTSPKSGMHFFLRGS